MCACVCVITSSKSGLIIFLNLLIRQHISLIFIQFIVSVLLPYYILQVHWVFLSLHPFFPLCYILFIYKYIHIYTERAK